MIINIEKVWLKMTPQATEEIIEFWESNKLLPAGISPADRVREVVLVAREQTTGKIAGVSSAGHIRFKQLNDNCFFNYRSVILPPYRVPGLLHKMIVETRDILETFATSMKENKCIGMLTFVENPAVIQNINEAVWPASKMVYIGGDKQGRQIRVYYFKGATI